MVQRCVNCVRRRSAPRFPDKQRIATVLLREGIQHDTIRLPHQAIIEFVAATTRPLAGNQSLLTPDEARREAPIAPQMAGRGYGAGGGSADSFARRMSSRISSWQALTMAPGSAMI